VKPFLAVNTTVATVVIVTIAAVLGCHERKAVTVSETTPRRVVVTRPEHGDMARSIVLPPRRGCGSSRRRLSNAPNNCIVLS